MPIAVIDTIKPKNNGTFPIVEDGDLKGGFRTVDNDAARDAIPAAHRVAGMWVWVDGTETLYRLGAGLENANWEPVTFGGGFTAGGDLSGNATSQTVQKIRGTQIGTAGGTLVNGQILRVTDVDDADWGALDLANGSSVTGVLPAANQASQTMDGDVSGSTGAAVVQKIRGVQVQTAGGALQNGLILTTTGTGTADWVAPAAGFVAGGDLSGTLSSQTVQKIRGTQIGTAGGALTTGYVLKVTGAATADWQPDAGFTAGGDLIGTNTNQQVESLTGNAGIVNVFAEEIAHVSTAPGEARINEKALHTDDANPHALATFPILADALTVLEVEVSAVEDDAVSAHWWKKQRAFLNEAGTVTSGAQRNEFDEPIGGPPAGTWTLALTPNGTDAEVVVNSDGDSVTWYLKSHRMSTIAAAGGPPPLPFTEAQFVEPVSITFDGTYLWTADRGNALLHKVDPNATPLPGVVEVVNLAATEATVTQTREIQYDSGSGYLFIACFDADFVLIVNPSNNQVIGKLPTGNRARSLTFDGAGNVWTLGIPGGGAMGVDLRRYGIAAAVSAYPTSATPSASYSYPTHHFEVLTFGAGYIWSSGGLTEHYRFTQANPFMEGDANDETLDGGVVWRVDPTDGTLVGHITGIDNLGAARTYFRYGNLWIGDGLKGVMIWDPAKFEPRDVNEPRFIPHAENEIEAAQFQSEPPADTGTHLWWGTGNVGWGDITKITVSPEGSETPTTIWHNNFIVDSLCSLVYDGANIWATSRFDGGGNYPGHEAGLRRINPTNGSEDTTFRLLPGTAWIGDIQPKSGTFAGGTSVTIKGWGFSTATAVRFAATFDENNFTTASNFVVVDDNTITCTSPVSHTGTPTGNVTVIVVRPTTNLRYARRYIFT